MMNASLPQIKGLPAFAEAVESALDRDPSLSAFLSPSYLILPGFLDVHVHLREPGFSYKETIASGTRAALHGGYTALCAMPNLAPVPDSLEHLNAERAIIERDAACAVYPYGAVTVSEKGETLSDMAALAPFVCGFSDDGKGVQSADVMRNAMMKAKALNKLIVAHCEDNTLLHGGYIHDGAYAASHGHKGICSASEFVPIARDIALCEETGCAYHVFHISTAESVALIRAAKARGVNITCETAPHYLLLDENDLEEDGRFKMNPPLRAKEDREALVEGLLDGTIDAIATDHAPHSAGEKAKGLAGSAFGVVGLETAFPMLYTYLVKPGTVPLDVIVDRLAVRPRLRFGIPYDGSFSVWKYGESTVDPSVFLSKGRATPFAGKRTAVTHVKTVIPTA